VTRALALLLLVLVVGLVAYVAQNLKRWKDSRRDAATSSCREADAAPGIHHTVTFVTRYQTAATRVSPFGEAEAGSEPQKDDQTYIYKE